MNNTCLCRFCPAVAAHLVITRRQCTALFKLRYHSCAGVLAVNNRGHLKSGSRWTCVAGQHNAASLRSSLPFFFSSHQHHLSLLWSVVSLCLIQLCFDSALGLHSLFLYRRHRLSSLLSPWPRERRKQRRVTMTPSTNSWGS